MGGLSVLAMPGTIPGVLHTARWHASTAPLVKANFDAAYRGVTLFLLRGGGARCPGVESAVTSDGGLNTALP
ncbi:hypothetical protein GOBAR_AA15363 [Gossypium barbadense]|uniref:Uncharacterized protein n=1 Tax=Gossypium barbadense TaxID=3634 RepID=A0A2P5XPM7_GOSBA|nr:hypothetical protein GOBAR_AA15363 [Gossypium barbadense]